MTPQLRNGSFPWFELRKSAVCISNQQMQFCSFGVIGAHRRYSQLRLFAVL
jgi:hypothetical protein